MVLAEIVAGQNHAAAPSTEQEGEFNIHKLIRAQTAGNQLAERVRSTISKKKNAQIKAKKREAHSLLINMCVYVAFLVYFHSFLNQLCTPTEFYMVEHMTQTFLENYFDADHNNWLDIRRISDFWMWTDNVLVPGLFGNNNKEAWPDGTGNFYMHGATPYSTSDLVQMSNSFNVDGVQMRQLRQPPQECKLDGKRNVYHGMSCYYDLFSLEDPTGDHSSFGYNRSKEEKFVYWTAEDLGASPSPVQSSSMVSSSFYPEAGFVALLKPFFQTKWSGQEENGTSSEITAIPDTLDKEPAFWCLRTTANGVFIKQNCDYAVNQNNGLVADMAHDLMKELRAGRWLDWQTRLVMVSIQIRSINSKARVTASFRMEIMPGGTVLPSFDFETLQPDDLGQLGYLSVGMGVIFVFVVYNALTEVYEFQADRKAYFKDKWNILDMVNILLFMLSLVKLVEMITLLVAEAGQTGVDAQGPITSWGLNFVSGIGKVLDPQPLEQGGRVGSTFGFRSWWQLNEANKQAKVYLGFNGLLQLMKLPKFLHVLVPQTSLLANVLTEALLDLVFFSIIFFLVMFAFADYFFVQLGSQISNFYTYPKSVYTLFRALFGDFDVEEILAHSKDEFVSGIFLLYLFVAVFLLLSFFFAILGEAQGHVMAKAKDGLLHKDGSPSAEVSRILVHTVKRQVERVHKELVRLKILKPQEKKPKADYEGDLDDEHGQDPDLKSIKDMLRKQSERMESMMIELMELQSQGHTSNATINKLMTGQKNLSNLLHTSVGKPTAKDETGKKTVKKKKKAGEEAGDEEEKGTAKGLKKARKKSHFAVASMSTMFASENEENTESKTPAKKPKKVVAKTKKMTASSEEPSQAPSPAPEEPALEESAI